MFFIFDSKKPSQLIFYILLILIALLFEYLQIAPAVKVIGVGILALITIFVLKSFLGIGCTNCEEKDK